MLYGRHTSLTLAQLTPLYEAILVQTHPDKGPSTAERNKYRVCISIHAERCKRILTYIPLSKQLQIVGVILRNSNRLFSLDLKGVHILLPSVLNVIKEFVHCFLVSLFPVRH